MPFFAAPVPATTGCPAARGGRGGRRRRLPPGVHGLARAVLNRPALPGGHDAALNAEWCCAVAVPGTKGNDATQWAGADFFGVPPGTLMRMLPVGWPLAPCGTLYLVAAVVRPRLLSALVYMKAE